MKAYHVDRIGRLREGQILTLSAHYDAKYRSTLIKRFPQGLSSHGFHHLMHDRPLLFYPEVFTEIIFEHVRETMFSERISRYQSFFALEDIQHLRRWEPLKANSAVFVIEANCSFRGDAGHLETPFEFKSGQSTYIIDNHTELPEEYILEPDSIKHVTDIYQNAIDYWSGRKSSNAQPELLMTFPVRVLEQVALP